MKEISIPQSVLEVIKKLEEKDFEAFVVGGCVRDLLRGVEPKDWDVTTNAKPEEILKIFPEGKYENKFGTVLVPEKYIATSNQELVTSKISSEAGRKIKKGNKEEAIKIAKEYLGKIKDGIHETDHTERVVKNALEIAKDYPEINLDVQELICWFHDVGLAVAPREKHNEASQNVVKKELSNIFGKKIAGLFAEAVDHASSKKYEYLEQQILKEADVIEGINIDRFRKARNGGLKEHIKWVRGDYYKKKIYEVFRTEKGKELLRSEVEKFNQESFGFKLEEPKFDADKSIIEITTYRIESKYSDKRHPDEIKFAKTLDEDLSRRDLTINALALKIRPQLDLPLDKGKKQERFPNNFKVIDLFDGQKDLENKKIRAVGKAGERFDEDALRMMRAVRFCATLESQVKSACARLTGEKLKVKNKNTLRWKIERKTLGAIKENAENLKFISQERIRDEFEKIILSDNSAQGVSLLVKTELMKNIIPEIYQTIGVRQNRHHYHGPYNTVYKHMLASLDKCPSDKLEVRLATFLHDIGKPKTKEGGGELASFYGHEYVGARMVENILRRLKFPRKVIDKTVLLVKNHMFYYNVDEVGEKGVRKVVRKVGLENINDLIDVRIGDRLGSGVPKAVPYKLRHFEYMVEKVSADPISVGQLKIGGNDLIKDLGMKPGPKIGAILEVLLARVIDNPDLNKEKDLITIANQLKEENLENLRKLAKEKIASEKDKENEDMKKKYWVK